MAESIERTSKTRAARGCVVSHESAPASSCAWGSFLLCRSLNLELDIARPLARRAPLGLATPGQAGYAPGRSGACGQLHHDLAGAGIEPLVIDDQAGRDPLTGSTTANAGRKAASPAAR